MEKRCGLFVFKGVFLLLLVLLAAKESSGTGLLTSLQFTRDAFTGFSRGSGRTVDILTPKLMPGRPVPPPPQEKPMKPVDWESTDTDRHKLHVKKKTFTRFVKKKTSILRPTKRPAITRPNPTLITYVRKRKTYRPRSSPSNKFLEAISDIERAVANARAEGSSYNKAIVDKFTLLLEQAVRRKSYKYGREILGKILYLFNAKLEASRRGKRSSQNEGNAFLLGLRQRLGDTTFDSFMAVQGDVSLVFVIDDTGSMADEIQATKNIAIDIINYPREAPVVDYILSPFNDPTPDVFPLIHKEESEAGEFVQAINSLTAHGGGDCPEYAFRGMLEAMAREPQWGSPMFVFTDAGPKDATEENMLEMMDFVYNYGVTINFFTTGYCRSQGFSGQDPRNLHPKFRELAEYTGGQAILLRDQWELEQLNGLTGGGLEGTNVVSIGSNLSNRKRRSRERKDSQYRFPVDDSIQKITVSVSTTQLQTNGQGITLTDPDGIVISTGKVALSQICIYQITDPKDGEWTIDVSGENGGHEFYVKSSSETSVDFEHYFVIPVSGRRRRKAEVPIFNAVVGIVNKLVITVAASEKVDSSSLSLELINKNGEHIRDVSIQSNDSVHYTASLVPPSAPFKLKLKGRTLQGKPFERISHRTVLPKTAVLRGKYASNSYSLPLNRITFIHFQLCNFGPSEYFNTTVVKDKMGYMIGNTHNRMRVLKNRCVTIRLRAKATRLDDVEKMDTVFVIAKGESSQVNVAQSMRLFVVRRL